jgi:hypothetical protein
MIGKVLSLKIATARILICICEAKRPLCKSEIELAVAERFDKLYDKRTSTDALLQLQAYGWISTEYAPTDTGKAASEMLDAHKNAGASKFFRKSNSPNFGENAPPVKTQSTPSATRGPILNLNAGTW